MQNEDDILAEVSASQGRRSLAYAVQIALGALLIYFAFTNVGGYSASVVLLVFGVVVLWLAERLRRATGLTIYLTAEGLHDSSGADIARLDEIRSVSRGVFAFKPSNGFSLVLSRSRSRAWAPGMWWRFGKRVGIGGVTAAGAGKFMAERIAMLLADRDG